MGMVVMLLMLLLLFLLFLSFRFPLVTDSRNIGPPKTDDTDYKVDLYCTSSRYQVVVNVCIDKGSVTQVHANNSRRLTAPAPPFPSPPRRLLRCDNRVPRKCRPGSASMPGFDEDDLNTSRTYWEPSVTAAGLASPEMVKLKVRVDLGNRDLNVLFLLRYALCPRDSVQFGGMR